MVRLQLQYQSLVALILLRLIVSAANYDLITNRVACEKFEKGLCLNIECAARPVKRYLTYVDIKCHLPQPIDNVIVRVTVYYKFTEYRKFLIDTEENVCDYLKNKTTTRVIDILMPNIIEASNIKSCPLQGDIIVKSLNVNSDKNPPGLPAGEYRLEIFISSRGRPVILVKIYLTAKPKGVAKHEMG